MNFCIYGEINYDILVMNDNKILGRWGGAGLYASIAAAKQAATVGFMTVIGSEVDNYSISVWQSMGVSFDVAEKKDNYFHPRYLVTGFKNFQKKISRPMTSFKLGIDYKPQIPQSCEGLLVFPIDHTIPLYLCKEAVNRRIPLFLDPKPNESSIRDAREVLKYVDVLLVNEEEALLLSENKNISLAMETLRGSGPGYVIIKKGVNGCSIVKKDDDQVIDIPSYKSKAVCTLGSGDVFGSVLAVTYLRTKDIEYSTRLASCVVANFIEDLEIETIISNMAAQKDMEERATNCNHYDNNKIIYLAGPFFCEQEISWVNYICNILEGMGFKVLSPSRENGILSGSTSISDKKKVFEADINLLKQSHLVIALLDHDDPGTFFELGYAFSCNIPVIGLKTSLSGLNNMILNGARSICNSIDDLINEVQKLC